MVLMQLLTIYKLYRGSQFYWWTSARVLNFIDTIYPSDFKNAK